jgi:hypothetical protein
MKLKNVDFSKKYFMCDGRKFFLRDSLSFNRYRELQKLILEFGFSASFVDIFKNTRKAMDFINDTKSGEAYVLLHNMALGVMKLEDKDDAALRMCALFLNEEGEDETVFDEGKMREKIDCWGKEYAVTPFFQLAATLVPSWINAYRIVSRSGSLVESQKKEQVQSPTE